MGLYTKYKFGNFGKTLISFASSQIISQFLRVTSGFLVVSFIDPKLYGQFTGIGVFLGYILLGHGGIINGLSRELPYELGRGNNEYARQMASSVFALSILLSLLASLAFFIFALLYFIKGDNLTSLIFLSYVIIGGLFLLNSQYLPTLYRTNKDFNSLSKQNILVGLGNLLSVLLVYYFSIYGLVARGVLLSIYQFTLLFSNKPYKVNLKYHLSHFKKLFKTGLPIFMVGQINPLWSTIVNNLIFSIGGPVNYGLYALSTIVQSTIGVIPVSFSGVIYPRMSIMLGEGKTIRHIIKSNIKPLYFQCGIMLLIATIGAILLPIVIPEILPKYTQGIEAAQWMLFVPVMQSFGSINNIYNVVKKQKWYFISLVFGAFVGSAYIFICITYYGFDLVIFPQGLLTGKFLQQSLSLLFITILLKNERAV